MKARYQAVAAVIFCMGCGSSGPFQYVAVQGTLSYEDGSIIPTGGIRLKFEAQNAPAVEGAFPRPAIANLNAKGHFDCATSYKYGDGLVPGKHRVAIQSANGSNGKPLVPKEYTHITTTPLIVDTADVPLEIKVPKP